MPASDENPLKLMIADERSFAKLYDIAMQSSMMPDFLSDFLASFIPNLPNSRIIPAGCVLLLEWTPNGHQFKLSASHHLSDELVCKLEQINQNNELLDRVTELMKVQFSQNYVDELKATKIEDKQLFGIFYIPLIIKGEVIGVLQLFQVEPKKPSNRDIHYFSTAAKIMAMGITQRKNLNKWIRGYRELELNHVNLISRLDKMCRDLSIPMTAVSGISEQIFKKKIVLIKDQSLLLKNSAAHLKKLIKKLIQQIEYGPKGIEMENQLFSFNDSFTSFLSERRKAVIEKGMFFGFHVDKNIPASIIGDVTKVQQVLSILIENAIKFTQNGEIDLDISIKKDSGQQLMLQFVVRDTGIGMTEKAQANLFQDAINADLIVSGDLTSSKGRLMLAKKMVEMMKGNIEVSSRIQAGSKFTFTAMFTKYEQSDSSNTVESTLTMAAISILPKDLITETSRITKEHHELIKALLNGLYKTVCDFNMESISEIEKLIAVLKNTVYRDDLRVIKKSIKAYDYSKASTLIEDFSNTLKISLSK
ncbi:MAG: hypothetical protein HOM14_04450 [Gammaproteobacteria bacterium]|jgi:signal transduction histidine kinase|nr:hypothetical protein [Gammaproteobacteria bacterium]MBT3723457.1 hypothetical protein [Gammaproteobacteria bacterium]MBT4075907.1 hypothetical protein [Gammaproteobacteria bacterium]MBT4196232.1 hypothetical protein [Gammaproteobacteria bacterium]MBT4451961.1 hypothetical protein [Gammaproteobacteria bacterium]